MPHYRDGTAAKIGDIVKGVPYNTKGRAVVGRLVYFNALACNCRVAFVEEVFFDPDPMKPGAYGPLPVFASSVGVGSDLKRGLLTVKEDYGQCDAFELVHRELAEAEVAAA